jgi:hypothetical protein
MKEGEEVEEEDELPATIEDGEDENPLTEITNNLVCKSLEAQDIYKQAVSPSLSRSYQSLCLANP